MVQSSEQVNEPLSLASNFMLKQSRGCAESLHSQRNRYKSLECNRPAIQLHAHRCKHLLQDSEAAGDQTFAEFKRQRRAEQDDVEFPDEASHLLC